VTVILDVTGVAKKLGRQKVLRDVTLACAAGESVAVYGGNGAGKSTLLQIIAGVLVPDRGAVTLCGESIIGRHVRGRRRMGYVPEAANPPDHLTVSELLAVTSSLKQAAAVSAEVRTLIGIDAFAHKSIGQLSLGERRRACLAAALVGEPALLVLDEPTNGLDASGVDMLVGVLKQHCELDGAVLLATHDRSFAKAIGAMELELAEGVVRAT